MLVDLLPQLWDVLAELYTDEESSRRVATEAKLDEKQIKFCSRAIDNWKNIVKEAQKHHKLEALLEIARKEYGDNLKLRQVGDRYDNLVERLDWANRETADKAIPQGWQIHEKAGDEFRERALQANLLTESRDYWAQAEEKYKFAIAPFEAHESIEKIRLYRKLTECLRKSGKTEFAEQQRSLAQGLMKGLDHEPMMEKLKEEAHLFLEEAYIKFSKSHWSTLGTKSEEIIKNYDKNQSQDIRWVVGSAYNLLAISLVNSDEYRAESHREPKEYWELANEKLVGLGSSEAKRLLQDVKINLAVHLRDRGDCDLAIQQLEDILNKHIIYPTEPIDKLRAERQIEVKYNLAVAYLDRCEPADLDKANELAEYILKSSRDSKDLDNWVWALQLQLNVIVEQIRQANKSAQFDSTKKYLIKKAEDLYKGFNRAKRLNEDKNWEGSNDYTELQRLLAEIYLAAGWHEQAIQEFNKINLWRNLCRNDANLCITRALLFQCEGKFDRAIHFLEQAAEIYQSTKNLGFIVYTNVLLAEVYINLENWKEAQRILNEAMVLAENLSCQMRVDRIKNLLEQVDTKST